jgi:hypothetical protein
MSRRIIQRIWTRTCALLVGTVLIEPPSMDLAMTDDAARPPGWVGAAVGSCRTRIILTAAGKAFESAEVTPILVGAEPSAWRR